MSEIAPAQRWPGTTWEQITDCMLRAADDTHPAGSTGGAWEVVQTVEQIAMHRHIQRQQAGNGGLANCVTDPTVTPGKITGVPFRNATWSNGSTAVIQTTEVGSNKPMPIENKYTAVYMYRRTG